ncbi:MAG TPA: tRNA lysidine(34) synthetase TilS [Sediminibacterium sp.]|nr:tRNA lysidine(34) synthetase TilS [Sediminibacterium sp.]
MDLLARFRQHWEDRFKKIVSPRQPLLLAVSGGLDSVVLADLLHKTGIPFEIAHMNFQLRGAESLRDEQFVTRLAAGYQVPVWIQQVDVAAYQQQHGCAIQEAARALRYEWFQLLRHDPDQHPSLQNTWLLTAHHADDAMETMVMHFFRGTGLAGLEGIPYLNQAQQIIRPLLPFRKKELQAYAAQAELGFVEDSTNSTSDYTRNYFRNTLLPQVASIYPQVEENLQQNLLRFQEAGAIYRDAVQKKIRKLLVPKGNEWQAAVNQWKALEPLHTLTWELIRPFGFHAAQVTEALKLLDADNSSYMASAQWRLIKNRAQMIFAPLQTDSAGMQIWDEGQSSLAVAQGTIHLEKIPDPFGKISDAQSEACLDASKMVFPLILRRWKTGDYFYPLGMPKKKKISRFLADLKLSQTDKEKVWVLESDKKILWVIGLRIDHRFRILPDTREALVFRYRK